jgi:hypothetical protein
MSFRKIASMMLAVAAISVVSCKDPETEDPAPGYTVPTTYNFTNVNYSGQTYRLGMMSELITYSKTANTGVALDAAKLHNMFSNTNNPFADATLNSSGKNLKDKVFSLDQSYVDAYLDEMATASTSTQPGSNGVAGVVVSNDGTKKYLCNTKGVDYPEFLEKVLMGSLIHYQISSVYLSDDEIGTGVDNTTVVSGEGTAMEHHWDEAFGYFGVPKEFPTTVTGLFYVGKYCNTRNALMGTNKIMMDAYLKGRAAISNKDMATKDAQVVILRNELERIFAASAISYINKAKASLSDNAIRNHALTEALGFATGLKYAANKKISDSQLATVLGYLNSNFYTITVADLEAAKTLLSSVYGMNDIKDTL